MTFKDRRVAETALTQACAFNGKQLSLDWYDPFGAPVAVRVKGEEPEPVLAPESSLEPVSCLSAATLPEGLGAGEEMEAGPDEEALAEDSGPPPRGMAEAVAVASEPSATSSLN